MIWLSCNIFVPPIKTGGTDTSKYVVPIPPSVFDCLSLCPFSFYVVAWLNSSAGHRSDRRSFAWCKCGCSSASYRYWCRSTRTVHGPPPPAATAGAEICRDISPPSSAGYMSDMPEAVPPPFFSPNALPPFPAHHFS